MKESIILTGKKTDSEKLSGKVVSDVSFYQSGGQCLDHLIITFTDNTYLMVKVASDKITEEPFLYTWTAPTLFEIPFPFIPVSPEVPFSEDYQRMIDLGIIEFTEEELKARILEVHEINERLEYSEYLRLKEKYEGGSK